MKETALGHSQAIMLEKCPDSKDRSLNGAIEPESEHGSELRGDEIGEGIINNPIPFRRLYSDPLRLEHTFT
jgi:hypothetical protein